MRIFNPYLNFPGNTEQAFNFYRSVLGGEFTTLMRFGDTPGCDGMPVTEKEKIMHMALPLGNGNVLMGTDCLESMNQKVDFGNNITISIHSDSREDADQLYAGLSKDGNPVMPMADMFWGDYWGMLIDKFGVQWMVDVVSTQK